ncbi:glycosyltransferase [Dankookia rubra]|uniref:Glycosyltransferase n=1 Tax=Dankookia rubra TaxID=1442381 RepID=A0A4R5QDL8_9PROT|nr:glycosyltransferase [Dankookia rubra]TDH61046.1 glycosyltransferase [Dankookia rubra]
MNALVGSVAAGRLLSPRLPRADHHPAEPGFSAGRPLRVLHVVPALGQGGAERLLAELVRHTRRLLTHRIVSLTDQPAFFDFGAAEVVPLGLARGQVSLAALQRARAAARAFAPDLVQCWLYHGNLAGSLMGLRGTPLVWSVHNTDLPCAGTKPLTRLVARLGGPLSRVSPDTIVYCSDSARAWHEQRLGYAARRGRVIGNGVDFPAFAFDLAARAKLRAAWNLTEEQVAIGTIGRLNPQKDHAGIAAALARLGRRDAVWVLAGSGCDAGNPALGRILDRAGPDLRTLPLGPRGDMPAILSALDLLVIGSAFGEALPMVALEAVANDLPVVATRVGSVEPLVLDAACLAAPGDPAALADAIAAAWPALPGERRRASAVNKRLALAAEYAIAATTAKYQQLYRDLIPSASGAAGPRPRHHGMTTP